MQRPHNLVFLSVSRGMGDPMLFTCGGKAEFRGGQGIISLYGATQQGRTYISGWGWGGGGSKVFYFVPLPRL